MVNEPKRIDVQEDTIGVAGVASARFGPGTGTILRRLTNYHNIWFGFSVEPEVADANAQGKWVLWMKNNVNDTDPIWSGTVINSGDFNNLIIACGVWSASNQSPYTFSSQLKSSRNLVANMELVLTIRQDGISSGNSSIKTILCAGLSVK